MEKFQVTVAILTALTPTVAVFLATLIQRQDVRDLRGEVTNLRSDMQKQMIDLRSDMQKQMIDLRSDMQKQMIDLRNQVHADLLMIHERVAVVEAKQGS